MRTTLFALLIAIGTATAGAQTLDGDDRQSGTPALLGLGLGLTVLLRRRKTRRDSQTL